MKFVVEIQKHQYRMVSDIIPYLEVGGVVIKDRFDMVNTSAVENLPTINGYTFFKQLLESEKTRNYSWWLQYRNGLRVV
jgi:hypothetical protein